MRRSNGQVVQLASLDEGDEAASSPEDEPNGRSITQVARAAAPSRRRVASGDLPHNARPQHTAPVSPNAGSGPTTHRFAPVLGDAAISRACESRRTRWKELTM